MEGMSIATQRTGLSICVETQSLSAVNMVNEKGTSRSSCASLVGEIKHLMSLCTTCITHINRSQDCVSDFLASFARIESGTVVWLGSGPPEVVDLCKKDCSMDAMSNTSFNRKKSSRRTNTTTDDIKHPYKCT